MLKVLFLLFVVGMALEKEEEGGEKEWAELIEKLENAHNPVYKAFADGLRDNDYNWRCLMRVPAEQYKYLCTANINPPQVTRIQDWILEIKAANKDVDAAGKVSVDQQQVDLKEYTGTKQYTKTLNRNTVCFI